MAMGTLGRGAATATACLVSLLTLAPQALGLDQFRAVWADAFHEGIKSTSSINTLVSRAVTGRYNAIIAQVLPYHDNRSSSHGAYWNSAIVPKATDISGGIDPLAYLCQQAHASGIEVHVWLLPFRSCSTWPPSGNPILSAHPEWVVVPEANMGGGVAQTDGFYMLDPGSPEVQDYLLSILRELVTNYPVDGFHWDYIRYTTTNAGYPSDSTYNLSGMKRFQRIHNYSGTPASGYSVWSDFRRRSIDELIRRCRAEIPSVTSNPRQPVRFSCSLLATGSAPGSFSSSLAYTYFQNWRHWMEMGWLDASCPMNYKEEHCSQGGMYDSWITAAINWRYNRHTFMGQANYQNTMPNSVAQLQRALSAGCNGVNNYSYYVTTITSPPQCNPAGVADPSWYNYVAANLFTTTANIPAMPWRNPATATEGTVWGRVKDWDSGQYLDNAIVQVGSRPVNYTDGNGYYVVTLVPATAGGTSYNITANAPAGSVVKTGAIIKAGDIVRYDLDINALPPWLAVAPETINRSTEGGTSLSSDTFEVWNANGGSMAFDITGMTPWLSVLPTSGSSSGPLDHKSISVNYATSGLGYGTYNATLTVTALSSSNLTRTINVSVQVVPPPIPGDQDSDGDVDMIDYGFFQACLNGGGGGLLAGCAWADLDKDNDVDQNDRQKMQNCLSGSGIAGVANCAQ